MGTRRGTEEEGKKITTEELITALRICTEPDQMGADCTECPFHENDGGLCVRALMAAVADRLDEMVWIPVAERFPDVDHKCYLATDGRTSFEALFDQEGKTKWYDPVEEYFGYEGVTHWMPMPEPPEVDNG